MLNSVLTTGQINYIQYIKPRYNTEPEFRKAVHRNTTNYINRIKDTEEYKEKRREISRQCYERHKEAYRETRRLYAREKRKSNMLKST